MIDDVEFDGKPRAHLTYAATLPFDNGLRILLKHLEAGTWELAPYEWLNAASHLSHRDDAPLSEPQLLERWLDRVVAGRITDAIRQTLRDVAARISSGGNDPVPFLRRLSSWFIEVAQPADAPVCASVLDYVLCVHDEPDQRAPRAAIFPMVLCMGRPAPIPPQRSGRGRPERSRPRFEHLVPEKRHCWLTIRWECRTTVRGAGNARYAHPAAERRSSI